MWRHRRAAAKCYEAALEAEAGAGLLPCLVITRAAFARLLAGGSALERGRALELRAAAERLAAEIGTRRLEWELDSIR